MLGTASISGWLGGWFGDFEKNAVSVFRVNEVDACSAGADFGFGVQQAGSLCAQVLAQCVNVVGAHAHLLQARAFFIDEFGDGGVLVQRSEELHHAIGGTKVLRADHGLHDTLLLIGFLVVVHPAEVGAVELNGGVKIRHGDAYVIEADDVLVGNINGRNIMSHAYKCSPIADTMRQKSQ